MNEKRIAYSYGAAVFMPMLFGFWFNGIGHFFVGRYKLGIAFLMGSIALETALIFFLIVWPQIHGGYALPWAKLEPDGRTNAMSLLPSFLITWVAGFIIWIVQVIDLRRIHRIIRVT